MYQEFDKLSNNSKVWIYNAGRVMNDEEKEALMHASERFCKLWKAHGKPLNSSVKLFYDRFLVLAVDESLNTISGCSIDESIYFVRELSELLQIDFLNRDIITFYDKEGDKIYSMTLREAKEKAEKGDYKGSELVFNNFVLNKSELKNNWIIPVKDSWLKNRFPKKMSL